MTTAIEEFVRGFNFDDPVVRQTGKAIAVLEAHVVRWLPYKPASQQFKRGIKGRWQKLNEYGGWDNCAPPTGPWKILELDNVKIKAAGE